MDTTTVAVDLAKGVFEIAVASGSTIERRRLSRSGFSRFIATQPKALMVMEACGSAHHWARTAHSAGHEVRLLPAQYVRPYRRRNKTDRADCSALLEAIDDDIVPAGLKLALQALLVEIHALEQRIGEVEYRLAAMTRHDPAVQRLQQIGGIGLLTSTALVASAGSAIHFKSGRHFASWLGLTPREHSSGNSRRLGRVSKRGDVYVRMLLTHGARSVLLRAGQLQRSGHPLNRLQCWALELAGRAGHNKAPATR